VKGRLLLDVVVRQGAAILELFTRKNETLLVWRDALLVLNLGLHVFNGVRGLDFERDRLARQRFHEDLHTTAETKNQVKSRLLLNIVVGQGTAILELLASEDETLLVWGNALLVLNLGLDVFDGIRGLNLKGDGLAGQGLDKDLHTTTETEDQVKGRLLLDVVVRQGAAILELFTRKNETLLVWRDALLVLNLGLHVFNGVRGLDFERDRLARQRFHEDLHTTAETKNQVKSRLLLNIVVGQGTAILELLASEDETLLVWGNALLVLDFCLDILNGVRGLHLQRDRLASECLDKNLHTTTETEDQMQSGLLLNVVIGQGAAIFELLAGEDETLLIWGDTFLVLDLGLDVFDGVRGLHFKGDRLASERLHKDLHATAET